MAIATFQSQLYRQLNQTGELDNLENIYEDYVKENDLIKAHDLKKN